VPWSLARGLLLWGAEIRGRLRVGSHTVRTFFALVVLCIAATRSVDASLASTHPLSLLAPSAVGALTACAMCLAYMCRDDG